MEPDILIVTGLLGSGKSAVCHLLAGKGVPVYDSDERTKRLYEKDPALVSRLEEVLGQPLRGEDGRLDRRKLALLIFGSPAAREKVEAVVYPRVLQDFLQWRAGHEAAALVALESAVILDKPVFDGLRPRAVLLVTAPEEVLLSRVRQRDGLSEEQARARLSAQKTPAHGVTHTLSNDGSPEDLARDFEKVYSEIINTKL